MTSAPSHISGIRVAHQHAEREVQTHTVPSEGPSEGPIVWGKIVREPDGKARYGQGQSGLGYRVKQAREWQVVALARRGREVVIGSARMQDHALALAAMWEQAVLSGRVDVD